MTFEQIVEAGRARALDFGNDWPSTAPVLYRRIQIREQELFTEASRVNPDYFGIAGTGTLTNGELNLKTLAVSAGLNPAASVTRVEVCDGGTSVYVEGQKVGVVSHTDIHSEVAPRVTLRNFLIKEVLTDLADVTSLRVYFGYRPKNRDEPIVDEAEAELPDVYQQLLVLDITRFLCKMTQSMAPEAKEFALKNINDEIAEMAAAYTGEVADFAGAQSSRFGSVRGTQRT